LIHVLICDDIMSALLTCSGWHVGKVSCRPWLAGSLQSGWACRSCVQNVGRWWGWWEQKVWESKFLAVQVWQSTGPSGSNRLHPALSV
jgi:hypothetical protein